MLPENMLVVIVGDREKVEQGLVDLKLGEMENLSIKDVLGPAPVMGDG